MFFFFYWSGDHRALHSFPTRRSSDLVATLNGGGAQRTEYWEALDALRAEVESLSERGIVLRDPEAGLRIADRKSTRLNSSHMSISYAVFCLKKKKKKQNTRKSRNNVQ